MEYKKGKENIAADALSKRDSSYKENVEGCYAIVTIMPEWVEDVKGSYANDPPYEKLVGNNQGNGETDNSYILESGLVRYKGRIYVGTGNEIRIKLMESFHSSAIGGHLGLLNTLEVPDMAYTHISMDFIKGLPKSGGKEVILVVVDRFTKYAYFIPLAHPYSVQQVVQAYMDHIFKLHGLPVAIVTDRDRIFTSNLFQEIFMTLRVSLRLSNAYHPQTDGQTERVN